MGLPEVYNSPERTSVANRLPEFLTIPGKTQLAWSFRNFRYYMEFSKPPLIHGVFKTSANTWDFLTPFLLGVFKTSVIVWGSQNPHYCLGFSKPPLLPGVLKTPLLLAM